MLSMVHVRLLSSMYVAAFSFEWPRKRDITQTFEHGDIAVRHRRKP